MQFLSLSSIPIQSPRISPKFATPLDPNPWLRTTTPTYFPLLRRRQRRLRREPFRCLSSSGSDGKNGEEPPAKDGAVGEEPREPSVFNLRIRELLDPDPDNVLAVGLTGLLAWASLQVLSQLFFISLAILVAALKYSFIAAVLLFILITLL